MPQKKKTARGAHLPALNKQHPKREESAGDANDLEYVDKPDDSSSSGESAGGDALVQSTLPFSGASSARKKGKKNKRLRTADGRSQPTLADFMPRLPPSLSAGATSQPPADAPADAPTSSPAAPTEEMAPTPPEPEPEQPPPSELAAEPPAKPKRGRPPGSRRPAQPGASNPSHCGRGSSSIGGNPTGSKVLRSKARAEGAARAQRQTAVAQISPPAALDARQIARDIMGLEARVTSFRGHWEASRSSWAETLEAIVTGTRPALDDEAATCRDLAKCLRELQSASRVQSWLTGKELTAWVELLSAAGERREALTEGMAQLKAALCGEPRPAPIQQTATGGEKRQRSDAGAARGPQLLPALHEEDGLGQRLIEMAAKRQLSREWVVGGEEMTKVEWMLQRDDQWEIKKTYAMAAFVSLRRREAVSVEEAIKRAAGTFVANANAKTLSPQTLRTWLADFVRAGGRIAPSRRGAHRKTECFLDLPNVKERAREWLRQHCQAARIPTTRGEPGGGSAAGRGGEGATPVAPGSGVLTLNRFHEWCNQVLLCEIINERGTKRKPICAETARSWLHALGFACALNRPPADLIACSHWHVSLCEQVQLAPQDDLF